MKLINFNEFPPFMEIREKMGISNDFKPNFESSEAQLKKLNLEKIKIKGLEISIEQLIYKKNSIIEHQDYPGQKMLLYIRDYNINQFGYPKYHIAWCETLIKAKQEKRSSRYVVSQKSDGIFHLNNISHGKIIQKDIEVPLQVCKYCLTALNYEGYSEASWDRRDIIFKNFNIIKFLESNNTKIYIEPKHTNLTQPINEYTQDWNVISYNYKKSKKFICQSCGKDCSKDSSELHVHHIDGVKTNNLPSNLEVLCVGCHSQKPMHDHMLNDPKFYKYFNK